MKNLKHLFTALLLLCGTIAFAEEVTINGIKYDIITKAKQAKVIAKETGKYSGNIIVPTTIEHNGVTCSVTSIGDYAFYGCSGLTSIEIPNSLTSIGSHAFSNCSGFTSITIPNSVTSIGDGVFSYCSSLTSITIPNSVTSIGSSAFSGCSGLTSITIPNSVTSIGDWAFCSCYGLTSIEIPNGVKSIGSSAFSGCSSLTSIEIPNGVTSIGSSAFSGCSGLTSITIPNSVTSIGSSAFRSCSGLTSITIPNSVTSIGNYAFSSCSCLTSITIPNSVTRIGSSAFSNCSGLTNVTIGSGVNSIYLEAFSNCENLTDVYCLATNVPSTNSNAFNNSYPEYMTLHVPAEAINDYKSTAPWSSFGTFVALHGEIVEPEEPEIKVCDTPTISYSNYKLVIECETEGAEFVTKVTSSDIDTFYDAQIDFSVAYNISVYAMATGYENSETVNATLCWIENGEGEEGDETNVVNVSATAVLITSNNGVLYINCALNGERVEVCSINGAYIDEAIIENGNAIVQTGLSKGSVAIVKIGEKSAKVIVD